MRKKRPLKSYTKKLLRKSEILCEKEMKLAVHRRDRWCQVCKSGQGLQVDHWISRKHKSTYFDINNLTLLCNRCHTNKSYGNHDYIQRVTEAVTQREGQDVCTEIRKKSFIIKKWTSEELDQLTETYKRLWTWPSPNQKTPCGLKLTTNVLTTGEPESTESLSANFAFRRRLKMKLDCGCVVTKHEELGLEITCPLCERHEKIQRRSTGVPAFLIGLNTKVEEKKD